MACGWRSFFSSTRAVAAALGLSACGFAGELDLSLGPFSCGDYPQTTAGAVNWDTARHVNMRIRQGEYWPMVLGFTAEQPYVLRIANGDYSNRIFRASEFFDSIAVGLVRVDGKEYDSTCLSGVKLGPRQTAEIWFVAKRDGRYEFEDQLVPFLFAQGAKGVIHISYAQTRHISPVSHLIVPEIVPTAPVMAPARPISKMPASQSPPPATIPAAPLEIPAAPQIPPQSSAPPQPPHQPPPPVAAPSPVVSPAVSPAPLEIPAETPAPVLESPALPAPEEKASLNPPMSPGLQVQLQAQLQVRKPGFWQSLFSN